MISRQKKLWEKFFSNWKNLFSSPQRFIIKVFKGFWFLLLWPVELVGDVIFFNKKKFEINPKKILIIKIDQLGDVLFSTLLVEEIKKLFPETEIDYLINKKAEQVLKYNPNLNKILFWENILLTLIPGRKGSFSFKKIKENYKTFKKLKTNKYDLVINARAFWPSSNLLWRFLSKKLISFDFSQFSFLANYTASYSLRDDEWKNYIRLLSPLGWNSVINENQPSPKFYNFSNFKSPEAPYICIAPVSFDPERTFTKKKWQDFLKELAYNLSGHKLVLLGLPNQRDWLNSIILDDISDKVKVYSDLSISDLGVVIKNSKMFIGLESFSAHLANSMNKKSFCLVNSKLFYISNLSKHNLVDGKSMLSISDTTKIFDLKIEVKHLLNQISIC